MSSATRRHALRHPALLAIAVILSPGRAAVAAGAGAASRAADAVDDDTPRYEPVGFPLIGGTSDIGLQVGGAATLTRFQDGIRPYRWKMNLVLTASAKEGPTGLEVTQQSYQWQWDVPGLADDKLRLNPAVSYARTINQGYFGLGNASAGDRPPSVNGDPARYFEFIAAEARVQELTRVVLHAPYDLMVATTFRYSDPRPYPGSKLEQDARARAPDGSPLVRGLRPLGLGMIAAGVIYDTRDNESFPSRGSFHQVGLKVVEGFPVGAGVRYGAASAILATYVPAFGPLVLAARLVADFQVGHPPFYDLFTAGPFRPDAMPGGSAGVRGVPIGRYVGLIKAIGNVELRAMLAEPRMFKQRLRFGNDVFFDAGRVWADYGFRSPRDGSGIGLKFGTGMGIYLQWGQAAVFRLEVAYSPDAASSNPGFPFGVYVEDGVMF